MCTYGRPRTIARPNHRLVVAVLFLLTLAQPSAAQDRTYNMPRHNDLRLDWCLTWSANCGRPAALEYCVRKQYADVRDFKAEVVGASAATSLIGTGQVCKGNAACTAFAFITCTSRIPGNRVFVNPTWKGYRLDVCLTWSKDCGKPAADAFCRANGFAESMNAVADAERGYAPTRIVSNDQICRDNCVGWQQIICR